MASRKDKHAPCRDFVSEDVARQIDSNLKRLYTDTASEELPKGLADLLAALRDQDSSKRSDQA